MTWKDERAQLGYFLSHAGARRMIGREEELALARLYRKTRDTRVRDALVLPHLRFVLKIAHSYRGYGVPLWELVQEGNLGLLIAAERFDPERGHRFLSYAIWWIRERMLAYVQGATSLVRVGSGRGARRAFFAARSMRERLESEQQREVSSADVAQALDVATEDVEQVEQMFTQRDLQLDTGFVHALSGSEPNPEEEVAEAEAGAVREKALVSALKRLDAREKRIVADHFLREEPLSLGEIASSLSLSRERVRQLEQRAMTKMRSAAAA